MNLQTEISQMKKQAAARIGPEKLKIMAAATRKLIESGLAERALKEGQRAPDFVLPNAVGTTLTLEGLLEKGPLVLNFYRGGWCPYCNMELEALYGLLPEIAARGGQLVAVSPQTPDHSLTDAQKFALEFEVLSDTANQAARAFGLVFTVPEELRPIYAGFGIDLPKYNGDDSFELPMPATYVIGTGGVIEHAFVNADYSIRMEPAEVVAVLSRIAAENA